MSDVVVRSAVEVPIDPVRAFRVFTEEIDDWWVRSPTTFHDGGRALGMRIEPGVGGRVLEVYDDLGRDALELGRITVWEPGRRLVFQTPDRTEAELRFEPTARGTRVSLQQRRLPGRTPGPVAGGVQAMLEFFAAHARNPKAIARRDMPRVSPVLAYSNVDAAGRWLIDVFGLEGRLPEPGRFPNDFPRLLYLCGATVILVGLESGRTTSGTAEPMVYAYVDDLEAHLAHARAGGARIVREIAMRGDRSYVAEDLDGHRWTFAQARPTQRL